MWCHISLCHNIEIFHKSSQPIYLYCLVSIRNIYVKYSHCRPIDFKEVTWRKCFLSHSLRVIWAQESFLLTTEIIKTLTEELVCVLIIVPCLMFCVDNYYSFTVKGDFLTVTMSLLLRQHVYEEMFYNDRY